MSGWVVGHGVVEGEEDVFLKLGRRINASFRVSARGIQHRLSIRRVGCKHKYVTARTQQGNRDTRHRMCDDKRVSAERDTRTWEKVGCKGVRACRGERECTRRDLDSAEVHRAFDDIEVILRSPDISMRHDNSEAREHGRSRGEN